MVVLASWAWPMRLTIPAPAAVIDPVMGRWLSTQGDLAGHGISRPPRLARRMRGVDLDDTSRIEPAHCKPSEHP
jgi:hypothetical protein